MKILVAAAEGDDASALPLRHALEGMGHDVTVVGDDDLAWQVVAADADSAYRLVVSEWRAGGIDGLALTRRIREAQAPGAPYRYVVLLADGNSGGGRDGVAGRQAGLKAGADDFLTRPLAAGELVSRIELAQRILALQQDVQERGAQVARLQGHLEQASPLGEILIAQGVLTPSRLHQALDQQVASGKRLGAILVERGWASEEDVTRARSVQYDVPYVAALEESADPGLLAMVPEEIARRHGVLPLSVREDMFGGESVRLALTNPWNIEALDEVRALTQRRVEPLLASETALTAALERAYRGSAAASLTRDLMRDLPDDDTAGDVRNLAAEDFDTTGDRADAVDQAPVIRLINTTLTEAIRRRASDVHIEPYRRDFEVRYRIDGELHVVRTLPRQLLASTVSRLKVMAELDIAERRLPQDGRISLRVDGRGVDLRISTLPNQYGERVVLRVLDRASASMSLDQLAFSDTNQRFWDSLIHRPYGIILVTGPTGSGKTTTLYATLNALKSPGVNVMTCEDPIEYELDRISQSNVNEKAGLTFARQLRAILRQDPDVVLVGEIRDTETAETAFRAALTGHLVLSTLHCNEAAGAPTRLADMGVPPFLIASAIIGVTAQRLVRRLCPDCREAYEPDARARALIAALYEGADAPEVARLFRPGGCARCDNLGYRGRVGVHEVLAFDERMQSLTMRGADTRTLRRAALEAGMVPMVSDGLAKAAEGLTTLEEIQKRVGVGA